MSIIELAKFKKQEPYKEFEYYCRKCSASYWRIKADGRILCGSCGAMMSNLEVRGKVE